MVRVGMRGMAEGEISPDSNARYNLQEAEKNGVKLGVYFFSTAISQKEAVEEADWTADFIAQYPITYPVVYDCEGFTDMDSRQYGMSKAERTDIALAFLKRIEQRGYEGMFYAAKNELQDETLWETSRIEKHYKIWVAQFPGDADPAVHTSSYTGEHQMWQYTMEGSVPGISQPVDMNVAYFGFRPLKFALYDDETCFFNGAYIEKSDDFCANTSISFQGEQIAIWKVVDDLPIPVLASKIVHEMFHGYQTVENWNCWADEMEALYRYQYNADNLSLKLRENELLLRILDHFDEASYQELLSRATPEAKAAALREELSRGAGL